MSDKELLELAAKAYGIEKYQWYAPGVEEFLYPIDELGMTSPWNPLEDDGDALRLAVKLNILDMHKELNALIQQEQRHHDRHAATRRAIVRAAAEIGRGL